MPGQAMFCTYPLVSTFQVQLVGQDIIIILMIIIFFF